MFYLFTDLNFYTGILLILALFFVLFYEAVNGFHDTANAVATVIYTRALKAQVSVFFSGLFNFLGVVLGGLSVAYSIVHLLPIDLLLNINSSRSFSMIFSMLLSAIIWNLGTWYFGIPSSSSHTLIGSIIGVSLTNSLISNFSVVSALNIPKVIEIFVSLIISPIIGFIVSGFLVYFFRFFWKKNKNFQKIHLTPRQRKIFDKKNVPPLWIRISLILSSVGVSFAHGSNDGQKGIGLIMLVLISFAPYGFALNVNASIYDITRTYAAITDFQHYYKNNYFFVTNIKKNLQYKSNLNILKKKIHCNSSQLINFLNKKIIILKNIKNYSSLNLDQRNQIRRLLICLSDFVLSISRFPGIQSSEIHFLNDISHDLLNTVEYAPLWIIFFVALALSVGTIIGWKRVVVTIGNKIGNKEMTYAQGVSAQITTAFSIGIASYTGIPVSTTHVLSSSVAGTMFINGGIQKKIIRNIFLVWIFTLPISIAISSILCWITLKIS